MFGGGLVSHPLIGKRVLWSKLKDDHGIETRTGHVKDVAMVSGLVLVKWERPIMSPFALPKHESWCLRDRLHILQTTPLTEWLEENPHD